MIFKTNVKLIMFPTRPHPLSVDVFYSYLNGDIAVGTSYDPRDSQRDVIMDGVGAVGARILAVVDFGEGGPDKL